MSDARDVIARWLWAERASGFDYDEEDTYWLEIADAILSALKAEGHTVAKLQEHPEEQAP